MATSSKQKKRRHSELADQQVWRRAEDRQFHMGRVMSCLKVGGVAKAVTSHYWKENYNTLAHHIAGNFVLEIYETKSDTILPK